MAGWEVNVVAGEGGAVVEQAAEGVYGLVGVVAVAGGFAVGGGRTPGWGDGVDAGRWCWVGVDEGRPGVA